MAVKNNYWKVLSKQERFYTAWPGGWEIHITEHTRGVWDESLGKIVEKITMQANIPQGCPRETRADFKRRLARDKRIAQSVTTKEAYEGLWSRIDEGDWEFIESNDLKDEDLIYWLWNTRTADEYDRLLRYN